MKVLKSFKTFELKKWAKNLNIKNDMKEDFCPFFGVAQFLKKKSEKFKKCAGLIRNAAGSILVSAEKLCTLRIKSYYI